MSHVNSTKDVSLIHSEIQDVQSKGSLLIRSFRVLYAITGYSLAMLSLVYFILFINDLFIPVTVNSVSYSASPIAALAINFSLLLLFGLQHSVMARPKFKLWLKQFMDPSIERATYCLSTGLVLGFICCSWTALEGQVWAIESEILIWGLRAFAAFGWFILVLATFNIDHFELFGLRQVYSQFVGKEMPAMTFTVAGLYKWIRHPIQTGLLIGMWSVPESSTSHFMLACGMTVYIFIGLYFEEKDLIKEYGQTYLDYIQKVGKVIPFV